MASFNKIILVGNLTRDPQLTFTPGNTAYCKFGIATSEKYRTKDDEMKETTCFLDCILWGKGAEVFAQYTAKGSLVLVEGSLTQETWETKEGVRRSKHVAKIRDFQFLGQRPDTRDSKTMKGRLAGRPVPEKQPSTTEERNAVGDDFPDDDLPF